MAAGHRPQRLVGAEALQADGAVLPGARGTGHVHQEALDVLGGGVKLLEQIVDLVVAVIGW